MERRRIREWAKDNLVITGVTVFRIELKTPIGFTNNGIKEALNQPHNHYQEKNLSIMAIVRLIETAIYEGTAIDMKGTCLQFHYFKTTINNDDSFIVVKENYDGTHVFYTIVDRIKQEKH